MNYHTPILLQACIEGLNIRKGGIYVDATFGGGGHSRMILEKLEDGQVIGIDQDEDAASEAEKISDPAFSFIPGNFRHLKRYLKMSGIAKADGILADLGVSSHQIDVAERGFSTRAEGMLDMRMDRNASNTARKVVNSSPEKELVRVFKQYGELRNASALASALVSARINKPVVSTSGLVALARKFAVPGKENKYLAQVFQALRIEVNDEMGALSEFLEQCPELLKPGGRLAIISYHSLEDRLVKNLMNTGRITGGEDRDFYGNLSRPLKPLNKKPVLPSVNELESNPRSRSAKLRIAEKI
jgi:16S rRNA (cytosine1402-N4)-methyltransferase